MTPSIGKIAAIALLGCATLTTGGCLPNSDKQAKIAFKNGRTLYINGDYARAVSALNGFASRHKAPGYAARALLIQGKAEIGRGDWQAARSAFEQLIERCGNPVHVVDGLVLRRLRSKGVPVEDEHRVARVAGRRRGEGMFLAVVNLRYQHVFRRFAQDVLLANPLDFHMDWHARRGLGGAMVQERYPAFDGVGHLHPIGEVVQNLGAPVSG